ncbi:MAG: hypothetical protein KAX49_12890 [Halanaerobiales bacterium]|nr:hypothetical protein [Halanaerobiales bacterium]
MSNQQNKFKKQNVQDIQSLTPIQEGMLYHFLKNPDNNHYFEQLCLTIRGRLDLEIMKKAWDHVV